MSADREKLDQLRKMAAMVLDARTQTLRRANEARDALQRQLDDLDAGEMPQDLPWPAPEMARFGYEQWAAKRRAEINLRLAAQKAVCLQAAEEARLAFGRNMAVDAMAKARRTGQLS